MSNTRKLLSGGLVTVAMLAALPAGAKDLDADSVRKLASGKTWSTAKMAQSTQPVSFEWKADGTVCLRLGETSGKCADSGTWKVVDQRICYEMTWWLKSYDLMSACLSVADLGHGSYEAKIPSGTSVFQFTVAK